MQIGRLSSILVLMAALLLPPGLFRNCCCTRQAAVQKVEQAPLRPCCQAKAAAKVAAKPRGQVSFGVHQQTCRCAPQLASAAVRVNDQQRFSAGQDVLSNLPPRAVDLHRVATGPQMEIFVARDGHDLDPPLRITLCRWVI